MVQRRDFTTMYLPIETKKKINIVRDVLRKAAKKPIPLWKTIEILLDLRINLVEAAAYVEFEEEE